MQQAILKTLSETKDLEKYARRIKLVYTHDDQPGISREKVGKNFKYFYPDGKPVKSVKVLNRIQSLAIPPAYRHVWIALHENAHIQSTAIDARGRKQYRYHPKWQESREADKFYRMLKFAEVLPIIRNQVRRDLKIKGLLKKKVVATVVALLEKTLIRVGNEEYAKENSSYGLTTMHDKHVEVRGDKISFKFKGKSGVNHDVEINEPELAEIVKKSKDLPGYELFQYFDDKGQRHHLTSEDVNLYLREISGEYFTAKDFRTWHATILAAEALSRCSEFQNIKEAKKNILVAIDEVASHLGNTRAVCRKSYIHPSVLLHYNDGVLTSELRKFTKKAPMLYKKLYSHERAVVGFLAAHAK
jgi:DNA topoisomerase I